MNDQRAKLWMHLTSSRGQFQLDSIRIIDSNVFVSQRIDLCRATAFVGSHGTGKSVLLRMCEAAFGYTSGFAVPPFLEGKSYFRSKSPRLEGIIEVKLRTPDSAVSHIVDLSQPPEGRAEVWRQDVAGSFGASYVDPFSAFLWLSFMYDNYDFTSERGDSDTERDLTKAELGIIRNILGRGYDRITARSALIDDGTGDNMHLPFVSATLGSKTFDNTSMSLGELWVHYVRWFLEHEVSDGDLALLDEPEAFLAARGQRPFIDHIAQLALRRDLQIIVGTHSAEILSRFPLANIRMCVPDAGGIRVITPTSRFQIRECIGLETPIRGLVLVEDELARQLLVGIFARYDTALTCEVEVIPAGGASEVVNGLRVLQAMERLTCLGVLDGDQRETVVDQSDASGDSILFLPGRTSPEDELLTSALKKPQLIAGITNTSTDSVVAAIGSSRDLDHQYQVERAARQLGLSEATLTDLLVQAWLQQPEIAQEAEQLTANIRNVLSNDTTG